MKERPIIDILREDLSPERWREGYPSMVIAAPHWKQMRKSTNLLVIPRKLKGPRKAVRSFTFSGWSAKWPNDELVETHAPLLMLVLDGLSDCCCGDYVIHIPAGTAIFVPAGVPRRTGANSLLDIGDNPERSCDNILFTEHCGSLQIWLHHDRGNQHYRSKKNEIVMVNSTRLIRLLEEINEEVMALRPHHDKIIARLLEVFLWTLQRMVREKRAINPGRLSRQDAIANNHHDPIHAARQYIREHLNEQLTQDRIAQIVRLSRTQFIRRFHQETGQTFNQFVTDCRIEQAKVLLQETDFTLRFISETLGLKSSTYLNTVFEKHVGIRPSAFRTLKRDQN